MDRAKSYRVWFTIGIIVESTLIITITKFHIDTYMSVSFVFTSLTLRALDTKGKAVFTIPGSSFRSRNRGFTTVLQAIMTKTKDNDSINYTESFYLNISMKEFR